MGTKEPFWQLLWDPNPIQGLGTTTNPELLLLLQPPFPKKGFSEEFQWLGLGLASTELSWESGREKGSGAALQGPRDGTGSIRSSWKSWKRGEGKVLSIHGLFISGFSCSQHKWISCGSRKRCTSTNPIFPAAFGAQGQFIYSSSALDYPKFCSDPPKFIYFSSHACSGLQGMNRHGWIDPG